MRIGLVVCILAVCVDSCDVLPVRVKEVQGNCRGVAVLAGCTADEPIVGSLGLAGSYDVTAGLSLEVTRIIPVHCDVLDELEGIHVLEIVVDLVCCHLQRTVHGYVEGQLAGKR